MKNQKSVGFTLVEIMIVVSIIALLTAIAVPNFKNVRNESRKIECHKSIERIEAAKVAWVNIHGTNAENPSMDAVLREYTIGAWVKCPAGGTYDFGSLHKAATCSIPEHNP